MMSFEGERWCIGGVLPPQHCGEVIFMSTLIKIKPAFDIILVDYVMLSLFLS
jgi:hypothetical protein